MLIREIISIIIACSCLSSAAAQEVFPSHSYTVIPATIVPVQDFNETVVPITELKLGLGMRADFGTGFCLDEACRFIGTNYHVAMVVRPRKIKGEEIAEQYLATGPDDEGATVNAFVSSSVDHMKFTLSHDLAIFELRHPLPRHHGVGFSLAELQIGQEVDIYAYPMNAINPLRSLQRF